MQDRDFAPCTPCVCLDHEPATFDRPGLFLPIILIMFAGVGVLLTLIKHPVGIVLASPIPYTSFIVLATFSAQRGQQPYFFECSIVQQTMPRLIWRHSEFIVALLILETVAFYLTRYMPAPWLISRGRDGSPFAQMLFILCMCLALGQVISNRSLLERAHSEKHSLA